MSIGSGPDFELLGLGYHHAAQSVGPPPSRLKVGAARHGAAQPQSPLTSLDVVNGSLDNIGFDLPEEAEAPRVVTA